MPQIVQGNHEQLNVPFTHVGLSGIIGDVVDTAAKRGIQTLLPTPEDKLIQAQADKQNFLNNQAKAGAQADAYATTGDPAAAAAAVGWAPGDARGALLNPVQVAKEKADRLSMQAAGADPSDAGLASRTPLVAQQTSSPVAAPQPAPPNIPTGSQSGQAAAQEGTGTAPVPAVGASQGASLGDAVARMQQDPQLMQQGHEVLAQRQAAMPPEQQATVSQKAQQALAINQMLLLGSRPELIDANHVGMMSQLLQHHDGIMNELADHFSLANGMLPQGAEDPTFSANTAGEYLRIQRLAAVDPAQAEKELQAHPDARNYGERILAKYGNNTPAAIPLLNNLSGGGSPELQAQIAQHRAEMAFRQQEGDRNYQLALAQQRTHRDEFAIEAARQDKEFSLKNDVQRAELVNQSQSTAAQVMSTLGNLHIAADQLQLQQQSTAATINAQKFNQDLQSKQFNLGVNEASAKAVAQKLALKQGNLQVIQDALIKSASTGDGNTEEGKRKAAALQNAYRIQSDEWLRDSAETLKNFKVTPQELLTVTSQMDPNNPTTQGMQKTAEALQAAQMQKNDKVGNFLAKFPDAANLKTMDQLNAWFNSHKDFQNLGSAAKQQILNMLYKRNNQGG